MISIDSREPPEPEPTPSTTSEQKPPAQFRVVQIRMQARVPWMTYALLAINIACFGWTLLQPDERFVFRYSHIPGAVRSGDYWRIVTATFLHASFAHIALNMLLHLYLGRLMERILGHWRFAVLYFTAGVAGGLFFQIASAGAMGMGASGAVYGVFGAFLVLRSNLHRRARLEPVWSFFFWATLVIVLDYAFAVFIEGFSGVGVAFSAHFGGFVAGAAIGFFWLGRVIPVPPIYRKLRLAALGGLVLLLVGVGGYALYLAPPEDASRAVRWIYGNELYNYLQEGNLDEAAAAWETISSQLKPEDYDEEFRSIGYTLLAHCVTGEREDLGNEILDTLIEHGMRAVDKARRQGPVDYELLNNVAWFCALRGNRLQTALVLSDRAVDVTRKEVRGWPWTWFFPHVIQVEDVSMCVNTRGWVRFRLGDYAGALEDLQEAVDLSPTAANFLYLGLAYLHLNEIPDAREAARQAHKAGKMHPYEEYLLNDLIQQLGGI